MKRIDSRKSGFTLLEVLISTSVIMVGVFGIAGAIALSEQLVKNSLRCDMVANCGRAALETMVTQNWLGDLDGLNEGNVKYYNWGDGSSTANRQKEDFNCSDHIRQNNAGVDLEANPPQYDLSLKGDYTWVGTIRKCENGYCEVSAAVTCKRPTSGNEVISASVTLGKNGYSDILTAKVSGISDENAEELKAGQYVYLRSSGTNSEAHWYRINSVYPDTDGVLSLELRGPHWTGGGNGEVQTPGGVLAAYTQVVPMQLRGAGDNN